MCCCSRTNASALYYKTKFFTTLLCITRKACLSVMSGMNVKVVSQGMCLRRVLRIFCRWTCLPLSMSNILMDAAIKIEIKQLGLPFPFLALLMKKKQHSNNPEERAHAD